MTPHWDAVAGSGSRAYDDQMRLEVLPRGIAGFCAAGEEPLPRIDQARFKAACYEAVRIGHGAVVEFDEQHAAKSYHSARLKVGQKEMLVVCNITMPYVAFADATSGLQLRFVDEPIFQSAFEAIASFHVLDAEWLRQLASQQALSGLSDTELKQFRYWRKLGMDRIGDVIFNIWD